MKLEKVLKMIILLGIMLIFSSTLLLASNEQNTLTVYTALEEDQIGRYLKSFKEQYPNIKLDIVRNSTGIMTAKLLAEKNNPQADVVWGLAATSLLLLDQQKMLMAYAPKGLENINPQYRDSRKVPCWVGIDAWMTGIVINTIEFQNRKLPIPLSYADLIKPIYKDCIVMPNPASSGTGFLTVSAILQMMGEKKGWEYLDALHKNMAIYTHSGSKPAKMAGSGEFPIGISFGYRGLMQKSKGEPVSTIFPKEGSGWDLEANALMKKKNINPAAKIFLDWAISDTAMREYNQSFAIVSNVNFKNVPEGFPKNPQKQLIKNDFNWAAKNRDRILNEWTRRYDSKSEAK